MDVAFPTIVVFVVGFFWLLIAAGLILLVVWVLRSQSVPLRIAGPTREAPLDILARRFAAGEINADAYKRARDLISGSDRTQ